MPDYMKDGGDGEPLIAFAITLRNLYLGTDYPEVAWQDASDEERDNWITVAGFARDSGARV